MYIKETVMDLRSVLKAGATQAKELFDDLSGTTRAREEEEARAEAWAREEAREQRIHDSARRFPRTVESFGGRIALVMNFGGEPAPPEIGSRIANTLHERGFAYADYITVNAMTSRLIGNRQHEFQDSRLLLKNYLEKLAPDAEFSSNPFPLQENTLSLGELAYDLERIVAFRDERRPGAKLGFVAVVSALEIGPAYAAEEYGGATYTDEAYRSIRFGGVLMPNAGNDGWEEVLPGSGSHL
jgi:hypothetical protein